MIEELMQVGGPGVVSQFFLLYFGKNLVRVERMDTGGPAGRFDVCLGVGFALVEVPEESLADTGASGAGVGGDCSTISRLQWGE